MVRDRLANAHVRLFVAFELPAQIRRSISDAAEPGREAFPGARWVSVADQHVTVKFLGASEPGLIGWVDKRVKAVALAHRVVPTALAGFGAFPSRQRVRVLWMGVDDGSGRMAEISAALDHELAERFASETRPFTPHVTLARCDPASSLPEGFHGGPTTPFVIEWITLFRSHLGRHAARYEALGRSRLGSEE